MTADATPSPQSPDGADAHSRWRRLPILAGGHRKVNDLNTRPPECPRRFTGPEGFSLGWPKGLEIPVPAGTSSAAHERGLAVRLVEHERPGGRARGHRAV